jgi:leucyl aminopeptidase
MPKIKLDSSNALKAKDKTLVLNVFEEAFSGTSKTKFQGQLKELDVLLEGALSIAAQDENFKGKLASTLTVPTFGKIGAKKVILLGLGKQKELNKIDQIRKAYSGLIRKIEGLKSETTIVEFPPISKDLPASELARSIGEVFLLANYKFDKYQTKKEKADEPQFKGIEQITINLPKLNAKELESIKESIKRAEIIADGVLLARDLIAEPPNVVTPAHLAKVAEKIGKEGAKSGVTVKILDRAACEKLKMGAFLAVARGSKNEPKFIHFHYKPKGKAKKHVAFVGKGITFDSGGLSLKPSKAMEKMKYDMAGGGATIGLMSTIAKLKPNVEITIIVAACENMPGGNAYRPGDVITAMNGKTMEINNTDAEGRVTLADAVYYASKQKPDHIIDIATLTGAIVVVLGEAAAGLMSNDEKLTEQIKKAFEASGERAWELPLYEDYEDAVTKGTIADMINAGSGGQAGAQNGALFIKQFVGDTPWVHLDIAGTCWPERRDTYFTPKNNPAGFGILTFVRHIELLDAAKK